MPFTRKQKRLMVEELTEKLGKAQSIYLADFKGISVEQMTELRKRFRQACDPENDVHVEFKVVKNTLAERAADEVGASDLKDYFVGPTAVAFGINEISAPAKLLLDFAKEFKTDSGEPRIKIKIGFVEKTLIPEERVKEFADLPPKEVLIAQVLGGFQAPISGFVGVLSGTVRKLVTAIDAIKAKKEEEGN